MKKFFELLKSLISGLFGNKKVTVTITPEIIPDRNFIFDESSFDSLIENKTAKFQRKSDQLNKLILRKFTNFENVYFNIYRKSLYGTKVLVGVSHIQDGTQHGYLEFTVVLSSK